MIMDFLFAPMYELQCEQCLRGCNIFILQCCVPSTTLPLTCFGLSHDRHKSPYWVPI